MKTLTNVWIACFVILAASTAFAQNCSTTFPSGTVNWTSLSWSCSGGGVSPTTNNSVYTENLTVNGLGNGDNLNMNISFSLKGNITVNSNANTTITIPAGVTVIIDGNFTDANNNVTLAVEGNLVVTGTLKMNNNTTLTGGGSISGGTLDLGGGTTGCAGTCPGLSFTNCTSGGAICANNTGTSTYIWDGSTDGLWSNPTNWTPERNSPTATDQLIFNTVGVARNVITSVPSQTVGRILVTGGTSYQFRALANNNTLTLSNIENAVLQIDYLSTLSLGLAGGTPVALNLTSPANSQIKIGGQLNLINGLFTVSAGSTLILHTNSSPFFRTSGQVYLSPTSNINFGEPGNTGGGAAMILQDNIFSGAQTVNSVTVNRTNGVTFGNQSITTNSATFTLGNLNTNAAGKIIFSTTATSPVETTTSKIIGYAQMATRTVGISGLDFLGLSMAAGNSVGDVTLTRRTGNAYGGNTFNANHSIDVTWDLTTSQNPVGGRNLSFSWLSTWDNVSSAANPFNTYYYNGGPGWTVIGIAAALASAGDPRTSAAKTATDLNDSFTLADNTQTLPVSFASFFVEAGNETVRLFWSTASENNNDKFIIEKKNNEGFFAIGEIAGAGNSVQLKKYAFEDGNPNKGWNYYRIKQVDYDGKFDYSRVVGAFYDGMSRGVSIFPNPAAEVINFAGIDAETSVTIQDLQGRVVYKGMITSSDPTLATRNFTRTSGLYYIVTDTGTSRQFHRVLIK